MRGSDAHLSLTGFKCKGVHKDPRQTFVLLLFTAGITLSQLLSTIKTISFLQVAVVVTMLLFTALCRCGPLDCSAMAKVRTKVLGCQRGLSTFLTHITSAVMGAGKTSLLLPETILDPPLLSWDKLSCLPLLNLCRLGHP